MTIFKFIFIQKISSRIHNLNNNLQKFKRF